MDRMKNNAAYEYLCHLKAAKQWMETVLNERLPDVEELEENLRNGVYLAKLGNFIAPNVVPLSRIYDIFQHRYRNSGLQFCHTDNINNFIKSLKSIGFPSSFIIETTDVYDKKNMPKTIFCIHALSAHLFRLGQAPLIEDLYGKVHFSDRNINSVCDKLKKNDALLAFQKVGGLLAEELSTDATALQNGIININKAIEEESEENLLQHLNDSSVGLAQVIPKYIKHYLNTFKDVKKEKVEAAQNRSLNKSANCEPKDDLLNQSEIQGHIRNVNINCVCQDIFNAVRNNNHENIREIIETSLTDIKDYNKQNINYYVDEALALPLDQLKSNSSRDTIQNIIRNGNRKGKEEARRQWSISDAVAKVKSAILSEDKDNLLTALKASSLKLSSQISDFAASLYLEEMRDDLKMSKDLTYNDIKSCVSVLNFVAEITYAVDRRDVNAMWTHLANEEIPFLNVDSGLKSEYFISLYEYRKKKLSQDVENHLLTFVEIQECIDTINVQYLHQTQMLTNLQKINEAVKFENLNMLESAMKSFLPSEISDDNAALCMQLLKKRVSFKQKNSGEELWLHDVISVIEEAHDYEKKAVNLRQQLAMKTIPDMFPGNVLRSIENYGQAQKKRHPTPNTWFIFNMDDGIQLFANAKAHRWSRPLETNGEKITFTTLNTPKFQLNPPEKKKKLDEMIEVIACFQAWIRGFLVRREIRRIRAAKVIQKWWRGLIEKRKLKNVQPQDFLSEDLVAKVIKIQAFWRGYKCRKSLPPLTKKSRSFKSTFQILQDLASAQKQNCHDYSTDLKVQAMKKSVVETIKRNQELSCKLEEMDMKIGLLVQNRISVEAIVAENKKLQNIRANWTESKGIKAFSREGKKLLDGYQQLFYLLQTDPSYLTRLIVYSPSRLNDVIRSSIMSIFNYGSSSRDTYLLLRLFRTALFEEVQHKFQKPIDALTGNSLVLKFAVSFARQVEGHNPLRNILGFLVEKVLNDKVIIDTNPLDIYRRWVNQMEMKTGQRSELSQTVTIQEALTYPEVVSRLNLNLKILKAWVKCFLDGLTSSFDQFPYALRFIAKLLRNALLQKFPSTPERNILKIVGNIVYYQYINSAIVAPDGFGIISLPPNQPLRVEQRRNLASIAKILHCAAVKKGFGEESEYLMCLNSFIVECHEEMKKFCQNCCNVEDLEGHFKMTKYSEAALIGKPRIYVTLEEIRESHKLLQEVQMEVAPDPLDPIHEVLDDLGPPPSLAVLIGWTHLSDDNLSGAGRIQVSLELDNKFQNTLEDPTEDEKLFIKTKELILTRIKDLTGDSLTSAIKDPKHVDIAVNLAKLELVGLVKSTDDYESILKSLIKDLTDKEEYRKAQQEEINILRTAQRRLNEKKSFHEDQLAHYELYLKTCLSNLAVPSNKLKKKERSVKYSGTRLREKGVLIALDGVPSAQLKNVQFEISTTQLDGVYSVQGRFMGVDVEKIDIDIQELLKLQFEGNREMNLFGKAQVNINLLLHLLNKKFHSRV